MTQSDQSDFSIALETDNILGVSATFKKGESFFKYEYRFLEKEGIGSCLRFYILELSETVVVGVHFEVEDTKVGTKQVVSAFM